MQAYLINMEFYSIHVIKLTVYFLSNFLYRSITEKKKNYISKYKTLFVSPPPLPTPKNHM